MEINCWQHSDAGDHRHLVVDFIYASAINVQSLKDFDLLKLIENCEKSDSICPLYKNFVQFRCDLK